MKEIVWTGNNIEEVRSFLGYYKACYQIGKELFIKTQDKQWKHYYPGVKLLEYEGRIYYP